MAIERVGQNFNTRSNVQLNVPQKTAQHPNFTGATPKPKEFTDYLKQKNLVKFLQKLKWFDGEEGRILITAIGTGIIAPLFIAWNPYVKPKEGATQEDKDNLKRTQKYTAMRQPISAALAIPIQLSLVKPINNGLDILFNNKNYSKYLPTYLDKSALQDDKYIERQEKKKLKGSNLSKKEKKAELKKNVKTVSDAQIESVSKGLLANGQIRIREGADGFVDNKSVVEALKKQIRQYATDANNLMYDSYSESEINKLFSDPTATMEAAKGDGKEFYLKRAETLTKNETILREVLGSKLPKESSEIANYLQQQIEKTSDKDLKEIYQEIIALGDADSQLSRCKRTLDRIDTVKSACGGIFDKAKYSTYMTDIETEITSRIKRFAQINKDLKEDPSSIKETISKVAENCKFDSSNPKMHKIFHDLTTFGKDVEKLKAKIGKDIVKAYKGMMGGRYRFIKEVAGISLGLFVTVPITCHVLNWVYPRFMDIFFPNLARKKCQNHSVEKNGGDK